MPNPRTLAAYFLFALAIFFTAIGMSGMTVKKKPHDGTLSAAYQNLEPAETGHRDIEEEIREVNRLLIASGEEPMSPRMECEFRATAWDMSTIPCQKLGSR